MADIGCSGGGKGPPSTSMPYRERMERIRRKIIVILIMKFRLTWSAKYSQDLT
jgi:hypothetical protein